MLKNGKKTVAPHTVYRWEKMGILPQRRFHKPIEKITGLSIGEIIKASA